MMFDNDGTKCIVHAQLYELAHLLINPNYPIPIQ